MNNPGLVLIGQVMDPASLLSRVCHLSDGDADVFGPSAVQRGPVRPDADERRVSLVVDEHLPAAVVVVELGLVVLNPQVEVVEQSGDLNERVVCTRDQKQNHGATGNGNVIVFHCVFHPLLSL